MATQYSNKPIVTDGLVYALDFGNQKSYVSGSATAQSLIYRPTPARFQSPLSGDIAQPEVAFSIRKVVTSYTGSAMMVQSASVSQSIGFDINGYLDVNALQSFAGSGDAFVKIWYDQSGNNNHATQSIVANQPKIVSSGSVLLENGKPAVQFDGINDNLIHSVSNLTSGDFTYVDVYKSIGEIFILHSSTTTVGKWIFSAQTNTSTAISDGFTTVGSNYYKNGSIAFAITTPTRTDFKNTFYNGNQNLAFYYGTLNSIPTTAMHLGCYNGETFHYSGSLQESILYRSNQLTNRTKIETNTNNYFQIYSPVTNPVPSFSSTFAQFTTESTLRTNQTFPGFSYNQGNSTIMYVGETKGNSTTFTQDGTLSIVSTTSSVGFGSPSNTFGRSYPVAGLKHVTLRFSSGSVDCFVNGIPVSASAIFPTGSSIGGGQLNIPLYTGSLGGFQVYNRPLTSDEIWNNYQLTAPRYGLGPVQNKPYTLDENAYLFLQSAGITDPIITGSIDTFVRGLKSASLWDKMIAIYPFVGTGSTGINLTGSHRWNLKEPSLVTYPLTFTGSWVGSTSGSTPSGSGTNITMGGVTPTTVYPNLATSSVHISILSYDTPVSSSYLMGTGMTEDLAISTLAGDYGTPAAAYSVRKVRTAYSGALMDVRRSYDNVTSSIGYVSNGDLDTGSLLDWVVPGRNTLPGTYSGLAAAYSLRRVSSSYSGPVVDIRRDSDNYIFPVGFTSSGDLDTQTLLQTLNTGSNIIPYSNDFTQARWNLTNTQITSSVILGPFGRGSGSFLNETSTNDIHRIFESFTTPTSSIHSISVFVKKQHRRYIALGSTPNLGNNSSVLFDLDTTSSLFTVNNGTGFQTITSSIHSVDDGWFRLSYVFRQGRDDVYPLLYLVNSPSVYTNLPPGYVGQPGTGSYIYGFQYTTGSILQPYIETTGSARFNQPITNPMGYVNTWYDQSGNGRHATQTATGSQPLIVSSGSLVTENGKPAINFIGANLCRLDSPPGWDYTTTFTTTRFYTRPPFAYIYNSNVNKLLNDTNGSGYRIYAGSSALFAGTDPSLTGQDLVYVLFSGSSSQIRVDNNNLVTGSLDTYTANGVTIGIAANNVPDSAFNGTMQELVFYSTNQSANRPLIENNINSYYNIYTGSNHGFVARWYDQSGNNRHASQTATGSQPIIVLSGSIVNTNSKPSILLDGTNDFLQVPSSTSTFNALHNGTNSAIFSTVKFGNNSNPGSEYVLLDNGAYASGDTGTSIIYDDQSLNNSINHTTTRGSGGTFAITNSGNNAINPNVQNLLSVLIDADNAIAANRSKIKINNGNEITNNTRTASPSTSNATYNLDLGRSGYSGGAGYMLGNLQELIIYFIDQATNQGPIEYNINNYYNIYPQTSSFATSSFTIKADSGSISGSLNNRLTSGIAASGPLGLITVSRTGSNSLTIARNGVTSSFAVPASGALSTGIYLGAINNNGLALGNSPLNISFASVGTGLTGAESTKYFNLVNSLNYRLGRGVNAEYDAVLEYAILQGYTLPSVDQQALQNQLISDLKNAGIWDKLDVFYVFATDGNEQFARVNWKNAANHYATISGVTPLFTTNQGYTATANGGGTATQILTNFNPTVHNTGNYSLNSGSFGYYIRTLFSGTAENNNTMFGAGIFSGAKALLTGNRRKWAYFNTNPDNIAHTIDVTNNSFIIASRENSTTYKTFKNGVLVNTITQTATAVPNDSFTVFENQSNDQVSMVFVGGDISDKTQHFNTAWNNYYNSISS